MLTKEEWGQAELGNDEIAYKEYCNEASTLTWNFFRITLPFIIVYFVFFKILKWLLFSKILLGILTLLPLLTCLMFFLALFQLFSMPKNKWLKGTVFVHLIQYLMFLIQTVFYIKFVLL